MKERRTEITVETFEILVVSRRGRLSRKWCENCGKEVAIVSLDDASLSDLRSEAGPGKRATPQLHLIEMADGLSFICLNSLLQN